MLKCQRRLKIMNKYFFDEQNKTADGKKPIILDSDSNRSYELQKVLGTGAFCVVYIARQGDRECLIKEFNPKYGNIIRNDKGELICRDDRTKLLFDEGLNRFKKSCENQKQFRNDPELKNYISPEINSFSANNTYYCEIVDFSGYAYSEYTDKTLEELLERIRAITKVIGIYHKAGYLHLDIKPENIFVLKEAEKLPILIDFDSITTKDEIARTRVASYSEEWAAAEQKDIKSFAEKVCPATDLFAIGETLFYKLFERHSTRFERRSFSKFKFNKDEGLLKDTNPKILPILTEIFNHTICTSVGFRYQTAEELIEKLDKAIELADPKSPFLPECYLNTNKFFVGRDKELAEIEEKLKTCNELYVSGVGGIGKSELVRQYAKKHRSEFDSVICVTFADDVKNMLASIDIVNINFDDNAKVEDRLQEKLKKLREFKKNGEKILFIIDNFNTELQEDEENKWFKDFLACTEKTIVTTRNTDIDGKLMVGIGAVENAREIFDFYYKRELNEKENNIVNEILNIFQGHTLATELLAKQMMASRFNPAKMFERLESKGLRESGKEKVKHGQKQKNAYSFLKEIFDVAELSEDYLYVLVNLSLIIPEGIDVKIFYDFCKLETYDIINELAFSGWINFDKEKDIISMHPLIADVMLEEFEKKSGMCLDLLYSLINPRINTASIYDVFYTTNFVCNKFLKFNKYNKTIIDFCIQATRLSRGFGKEDTYIKLLEKILVYVEKERNIEDLTISMIFNELGTIYSYKQNYKDAEKCNLIALSYAKSIRCSTDYLMALYCNLMEIYRYMEYYDRAKILFEESLLFCEKEYNEETYRVADMHSVCGAVCQDLNEMEEAENHYRLALEIRIRLFGEASEITSYSYGDFGDFYYSLDRFDDAEKYYSKALEIQKNYFGNNHINISRLYLNLAKIKFNQGKIELADDYCYEALKISDKIYGDNLDTADVLFQVALIYRERNELDNAIAMLIEVNDIYLSYYKVENNEDVAKVYSALGKAYELDKQYEKAKECYMKSIDIRKELLAPDHPKTKFVEQRLLGLERLITQ